MTDMIAALIVLAVGCVCVTIVLWRAFAASAVAATESLRAAQKDREEMVAFVDRLIEIGLLGSESVAHMHAQERLARAQTEASRQVQTSGTRQRIAGAFNKPEPQFEDTNLATAMEEDT